MSRSRLHSSQDGYSLVVVMLVMLVGTLVSVGAWQAANGAAPAARKSTADKYALAAAQAGIADYLQKLGSDNEYWLKCTDVAPVSASQPAPVNQINANPLVWRPFGPRPNVAYTIELIPRPGYSACQKNVDASMLSSSGTIQIRTTGRSGAVGTANERHRSLITTLRRNGFLDFLYFTEYETRDPLQRDIDSFGLPTRPCLADANPACAQQSLSSWADQTSTCRRWVRDGRNSSFYQGSLYYQGAWHNFSEIGYPDSKIYCGSIQWKDGEANAGPFHTNDTVSICNQPQFGRNRTVSGTNNGLPIDRVEYWDYAQTCNGAGPDVGNNTVLTGAAMPILQLPQSNTELLKVAQNGGIVYTGRTQITLTGTTMTVTNPNLNSGNPTTGVSLPGNGVIYVQNGTGCPGTNVTDPYNGESSGAQNGCGDAIVQGSYGAGLTIAAARDVQIAGDVKASSGSNALLGLIANNFIRVRHEVDSYPCASNTGEGTVEGKRRIEAAMLSLGHVFTVDNYQCGDPLGDLEVFGAIAQRYRGPVGTYSASSGAAVTGYQKKYTYDDRLKYRSPPYFLAPVQSAWRVVRSTEQVPPR